MTPPITYPLCLQHDCPVADSCLRHEAYAKMSGPVRPHLTIVNPAIVRPGHECPSYQAAMPVRIAYGFLGLLSRLPHGQVAAVRQEICESYPERTYYKLRSGERPLTPREQQEVAAIFVAHGLQEPVEFDRYAEEYEW